MGPLGVRLHPEDVFSRVFVRIFRIGEFCLCQLLVLLNEGVRYVFQEYQAEDDMLLFRGVNVFAKFVLGFEKLILQVFISVEWFFVMMNLFAQVSDYNIPM